MKIIISEQADFQLKSTALYIQTEFGSRYRVRFIDDYRHILGLLRQNPRLGPVEPLLETMSGEYRSVVFGHINKLVYLIHDDVIHILDIWDTRRDPSSLVQRLI